MENQTTGANDTEALEQLKALETLPQPGELLDGFAQQFADDPESVKYIATHRRRYGNLIAAVWKARQSWKPDEWGAPYRILDVGPAYQTELLRQCIPSSVVDTLGWADPRFPTRDDETHIQFDLNGVSEQHADDESAWPKLGGHDLVVAAEVIEHLYTAPEQILRFLATGLAPGGRLLVQTPNAASLFKRLKLLGGRNPYEPIRENRAHPGHFREYTVAELKSVAAAAGLEVESVATANYFDHGSRKHRVFIRAEKVVPSHLRDGITIVYRRRS